jgi:nucleotide-binding universal stress UspA family protein
MIAIQRGATMIVVGIDGSDQSRRALEWALEEARLRRLPLRVVHTWTYPRSAGFAYVSAEMIDPSFLSNAASDVLDETVGDVLGDATDVQIEKKVVEGAAARVLVEEAQGAELLVVGSRGHGGFSGLLLGSVSQQCAHHAPCPVVIVGTPGQP